MVSMGESGQVAHNGLSDVSRYYAYGRFLREKFGCRVHKVSLDAGFGCPNTDGTVGKGGASIATTAASAPLAAGRGYRWPSSFAGVSSG